MPCGHFFFPPLQPLSFQAWWINSSTRKKLIPYLTTHIGLWIFVLKTTLQHLSPKSCGYWLHSLCLPHVGNNNDQDFKPLFGGSFSIFFLACARHQFLVVNSKGQLPLRTNVSSPLFFLLFFGDNFTLMLFFMTGFDQLLTHKAPRQIDLGAAAL